MHRNRDSDVYTGLSTWGRRLLRAGVVVVLAGLAACGGSEPVAALTPDPVPTSTPGPDAGPVVPVMRCAPAADTVMVAADCERSVEGRRS